MGGEGLDGGGKVGGEGLDGGGKVGGEGLDGGGKVGGEGLDRGGKVGGEGLDGGGKVGGEGLDGGGKVEFCQDLKREIRSAITEFLTASNSVRWVALLHSVDYNFAQNIKADHML